MKKEMSEEKFKDLLDKINLSVGKLYHIATHDQKTGLHNYVFFKEVFGFELDKARRGKTLSLIVIDIDFFKKVNDNYGHLTADNILIRLARVLEKSVRKYGESYGTLYFLRISNKLSEFRILSLRGDLYEKNGFVGICVNYQFIDGICPRRRRFCRS